MIDLSFTEPADKTSALTGKRGCLVYGKDKEETRLTAVQVIANMVKSLVLSGRTYNILCPGVFLRDAENGDTPAGAWAYKARALICLANLDDTLIGEYVSAYAVDNAYGVAKSGSRNEIDPDSNESYKVTYVLLQDGREFIDGGMVWQRTK